MRIRSPREAGACEPLINTDFQVPRVMEFETPVSDTQSTHECLVSMVYDDGYLTYEGVAIAM